MLKWQGGDINTLNTKSLSSNSFPYSYKVVQFCFNTLNRVGVGVGAGVGGGWGGWGVSKTAFHSKKYI